MRNQPFCPDESHPTNRFYFCQNCAEARRYEECFYCSKCSRQVHESHSMHSKKCNFVTEEFSKMLSQYKNNLDYAWRDERNRLERTNNRASNPLSNFFIMQKDFTLEKLKQYDVRKQFIDHQFWLKDGELARKAVSEIVRSQEPIIPVIDKSENLNSFAFDWANTSQGVIDPQKFSQEAEAQCKEHQKELDILKVLIQVYASYSVSDCRKCYSKVEDLISRYPKEQILYYSLMRLYQLSGKNQSILNVLQQLKNIDSNATRNPEYSYYQAMAQWRMVDEVSYQKMNKNSEKCIFYDAKNKMHYYINNPDNYLKKIQNALEKDNCDIFKAAKANGLLALKKNAQAASLLKEIKNPKDTQLNNLNYSLMQNGEKLSISLQHSRPFLVNQAKYCKRQKNYLQLVNICNKILIKEPKNQNIKVEKVLALCKIGNQDTINKAELLIKEINSSKTKTLLLELSRAKGKLYWKNNSTQRAINQFINVNNNEDSASSYYNLAASYYKDGRYSDADRAIKKCLNIKESQKALKLALYIVLRCGEIEEGSQIYKKIIDPDNKLAAFKEYFASEL